MFNNEQSNFIYMIYAWELCNWTSTQFHVLHGMIKYMVIQECENIVDMELNKNVFVSISNSNSDADDWH